MLQLQVILRRILWLLLIAATCSSGIRPTCAQDGNQPPQWIWSPEHKRNSVPQDDCYFRKNIYLQVEFRGRLEIAADDDFEAYVNGKKVASGASSNQLRPYDISSSLKVGKNIVAIKVSNRNGGTAGLAAQVCVESDEIELRKYITNSTWRTSTSVLPLWYSPSYRDTRWDAAQSWGRFEAGKSLAQVLNGSQGKTQQEVAADKNRQGKPRPLNAEEPSFRIPTGFQIQHVLGHADAGSLLAMTFNEFGQIVASRDGGPLIVVYDTNDNAVPDAARVCCDKVKSCRGLLALSGRLYVVGDGPDGAALYRLEDRDRDGMFEDVRALVEFEGKMGDFGPQAVTLGPDGLLYVSFGGQTRPKRVYDERSPYRLAAQGDLVKRYDDPSGTPANTSPTGGGILRIDSEGERVELLASGFRNVPDMAFAPQGELFAYDWGNTNDQGLPWSRANRLIHVVPGGEYGWRPGWSIWPEHWIDSLPPVTDVGSGMPTGCTFYDHIRFPVQYRGMLFASDWAAGTISAVTLQAKGAGFAAVSRKFLEGSPINITDVEVGPDGWLYFTTGGRGTKGNVYRIVYEPELGTPPTAEPGVLAAVRQPQGQSAWARQTVSTMRRDLAGQWDFEIRAYVNDRSQTGADRARAANFMHLVGPPPSDAELAQMVADSDPVLRAQAASLLALIRSDTSRSSLVRLLEDPIPLVRRRAAEGLVRNQGTVAFSKLVPMLTSRDRFESTAARHVLQQLPLPQWESEFLQIADAAVFAETAIAAMATAPSRELAIQIVDRSVTLAEREISEDDLADQLRVIQLAMERGALRAGDVPVLGSWLAKKYPSANERLNRELVRLLIPLQNRDALPRMLGYLESAAPDVERLHLGLQLRYLADGWQPDQKARVLAFYEQASNFDGGRNLTKYVEQVANDFLGTFTAAERGAILDRGEKMPHVALATLFQLAESEDAANVERLIGLDRRLPQSTKSPIKDLKVGILAILARSGDGRAMTYLREVYDNQPERRPAAVMALAQQPGDRNWDYLVRSLPLLDDEPAKEVLTKLREVDAAPEDIEHYRQAILCGLRLKEDGGMLAVQLLEHWVGKANAPPDAGSEWSTALPAWQEWFQNAHPKKPTATLPVETGQNMWCLEDLETYLQSEDAAKGSVEEGRLVFENSKCIKCHVHGNTGEPLGPNLTSLATKYQRREVLEALLFPSHRVADQFLAYEFKMKDGRTIKGQVIPEADQRFMIVQATGESEVVQEDDIDTIVQTRSSAMPEGLLNELTLREIADLFAFLFQTPRPEVARAK